MFFQVGENHQDRTLDVHVYIYLYFIICSYWTYIYKKYISIFRERDDICIWLLFNSAMCHRQNWRTESDSHSVLQTKNFRRFRCFTSVGVVEVYGAVVTCFFLVSLGLLAWSTGECYSCRKVWKVNLTHVLIFFRGRSNGWDMFDFFKTIFKHFLLKMILGVPKRSNKIMKHTPQFGRTYCVTWCYH